MRADFRLEDWIVRPRRGYIERGDETVHIHPKAMAVLEYLAATPGEVVTRDELFDQVWPGVIVTDDALAQCVVELRKAFHDSARDARIIQTIPKSGFCLVPPVTALPDIPPATKTRSRIITLGILVVTALAVAVFQFLPMGEDATPLGSVPQDHSSIAVLPFVNRSAGLDDAYFSDGVHDELLSRLSRISGLRVISRTSVNRYRETEKSMPEIADELSVGAILEGSVQRDGNRVRINVQLIEAHTDTHLWSETYDGELVDIFALQDRISAAIAAALKDQLGLAFQAEPQAPVTRNTEAYEAYLRGRYLVALRSTAGVEGAIREFESAVALQSDFGLAHAELAMTLLLAGNNIFAILEKPDALRRAAIHAERAMVLDPGLAESHAARGGIFAMKGAPEEALQAFDQALRINPNYADVHSWKALILAQLGHYRELGLHQELALRLDPLSLVAANNYIHTALEQSRWDDAARELEKIRTLFPRVYADYHGKLMSAGGKWGYLVLGLLEKLKIDAKNPVTRAHLAWLFAFLDLEREALAVSEPAEPGVLIELGRPGEAIQVAEAALAREQQNGVHARQEFGMTLAATGDFARALPLLEQVAQQGEGRITMGRFNFSVATALLAARRDAGDERGVNEILRAMRDDVQRLREAGYGTVIYGSVDFNEGLLAYFEDEREKAVTLIGRAMENGYFVNRNRAYLQWLYEDPDYVQVFQLLQDRRERERKRVLDVVCESNPYAAVWVPAGGTCE